MTDAPRDTGSYRAKMCVGIIQKLPRRARDDIMYELNVRQKIEAGIAAARRRPVVEHREVKKRLLP